MTKASDNLYPKVLLDLQTVSPAAPSNEDWKLYAKPNGIYARSSNSEVGPFGGGGGDVATDAIWDAAGDLAVGSGANTAARLAKGAAGANLSTYNGVVAWNGGTSFPASPASGDRYWRTDLGMEAYYDGTRWLTTQVLATHIGPTDAVLPSTTSGRRFRGAVPWKGTYSLYLLTCWMTVLPASTNNGSNYWNLALYRHDATDTTTQIGSTLNTSADTENNWTSKSIAINAVLDSGAYSFSIQQTTGAGAPNAIYVVASVQYRLVLT